MTAPEALDLLKSLLTGQSVPVQVRIKAADDSLKVLFTVEPEPAKPVRQAPTIRPEAGSILAHIWNILTDAGHRLTGQKILDELTRRQVAYSESTVRVALSVATEAGLLTNSQDGPYRGYGLPEWDAH